MSDIAGYIDRSYIKGQYYMYAAAPRPVVSNANINEISSDLLSKAMFVTRGQTAGTLPDDSGTIYLITTVQYGTGVNTIYLQTAFSATTGYEYRRIYNGSWLEWIGVDSSIKAVDEKVESVKANTESNTTNIATLENTVANLGSSVSNASSLANSAYGMASTANNNFSSLSTRLSPLGSKIAMVENTVASITVNAGYSSSAITVNIENYNFTRINAIFPSTKDPGVGGYTGIPYVSDSTELDKFQYRIYRPSGAGSATYKNRVTAFLILGD